MAEAPTLCPRGQETRTLLSKHTSVVSLTTNPISVPPIAEHGSVLILILIGVFNSGNTNTRSARGKVRLKVFLRLGFNLKAPRWDPRAVLAIISLSSCYWKLFEGRFNMCRVLMVHSHHRIVIDTGVEQLPVFIWPCCLHLLH
jgi:hypothetical protein